MIMHSSSRQALSSIFLRGFIRVVVTFMLFATVQGSLWAQDLPNDCGVLRSAGGFGPYDYRPSRYIPQSTHKSHEALLNIVERAHFTPAVEANFRGNTGVTSGGDLTYTLHAFPNHHRALLSMVALGTKERTDKPYGVRYTIECYFKRAIAFRPDDRIVRLIYASFLVGKGGRNDEADAQLNQAARDSDSDAFTYRNIGLIYLDMKRYDEALKYSHKSISLGLAGGPLQDKLVEAGRWTAPSADEKPALSKP